MIGDLLVLFGSCVKVGLLAFGGGNSAIPLLEAEVVPRWLTSSEYGTLVSINFGLPGISMMKLAGMIGLRVAGLPGLVAATIGIAAPGLLLTIGFAQLIQRGQDNIVLARVLTAMKYAAGALLLSSAMRLLPPLRARLDVGFGMLIVVMVLVMVHKLNLNPALAILASMAAGALVL